MQPGVDWHVVVYACMGVYPHTRRGALALLERAAELAVCSGSERLIVKTAAEAHRIPTIAENVEAPSTSTSTSTPPLRDGEAILSPSITQRLIPTFAGLPPTLLGTWAENSSAPPSRAAEALGSLTERELDVLILVGNGLSEAEIATRLDLSESNV